jgi:caa(3)-type oxidase subunit IV
MSDSHNPEHPETGITDKPHEHGADGHADAAGHDDHGHHGPSMKTYFVIFGALTIFTGVSFVANYLAHPDVKVITVYTSFAIIMGVALCKATLVGMYFMHLILDWGKVFLMIVPALVLGPMLMIVLLPDIVLAWKHIITP